MAGVFFLFIVLYVCIFSMDVCIFAHVYGQNSFILNNKMCHYSTTSVNTKVRPSVIEIEKVDKVSTVLIILLRITIYLLLLTQHS